MNGVFSNTVDATIEHSTRSKKCAETCTKAQHNQSVDFLCSEKCMRYTNLTKLSSGLHPQGNNGAPGQS